jgi:hypothetical protein
VIKSTDIMSEIVTVLRDCLDGPGWKNRANRIRNTRQEEKKKGRGYHHYQEIALHDVERERSGRGGTSLAYF